MSAAFLTEAKLSALFHNESIQRVTVWGVILLIHAFLWIALNRENDVSRSRKNVSVYLSVVQISLQGSSMGSRLPVQERPPNIQKTSPKQHAIRRHAKGDYDKRIAVQKKLSGKEKGLNESKKARESQDIFLEPIADDSSKVIHLMDYDAMKQIARSIAHKSEKHLLPGSDKKLTSSQKFANAIDQAKRSDCRSAHAHLGILAIPILLKDAVTDEGCKW
ncbi:MAG TPA: hypothetical protein VGN04_12560 [Herbaspirillum sp.]|jgi:hypothetical protein